MAAQSQPFAGPPISDGLAPSPSIIIIIIIIVHGSPEALGCRALLGFFVRSNSTCGCEELRDGAQHEPHFASRKAQTGACP
jgi:hypothetical protein